LEKIKVIVRQVEVRD